MNSRAVLLASDMDGTLLPERPDPSWPEACRQFHALVRGRRGLRLAYVTGRDLERARQGILESGLPKPHWLVCDVGSALYRRQGRLYHADRVYRDTLRTLLGGRDMTAVRRALEHFCALTPQEDDRQTDFKCSYYLEPETGPRLLPRLRACLAQCGLKVSLVYSVDRVGRQGLLDILPRGIAKDSALHFLRQKLDLPLEQVVYAGDSGNDLAAFLSGCRALLVANTPPDIKARVQRAARRGQRLHTIYIAEKPWLHGVLEGCAHFGL